MREKIHTECLNAIDDRVFVSYDPESREIRTATKEFLRRYKSHIWVVKLLQPLFPVPRRGQRLRFTMWHHSFPVKIEAKVKSDWETIYELDDLPYGHKCLAGCY